MDRKSIAVVVGCGILLVLWMFVITPKYLTKPLPPEPTNTVTSAQATLGTNGAPAFTSSSTNVAPQLEVNTNTTEQLLVVTNENARYTFTSYGGGLKLVELVNFPETVPSWRNRRAQSTTVATLN